MSRLRVAVLCPGRGSYQRPELGSLQGLASPFVDAFDAWRAARGGPTVRELDSADRYRSALHVAGEQASLLTAGVSLADLDQLDHDKAEVVAVCGNSMGWYTALTFAGALSAEGGARLIDTMGAWQARSEHGVVGGQLVYPLTGPDWRPDPVAVARVQAVVDEVPGLYWSIRLGGQAVLGGTEEALAAATERLPVVKVGANELPLRLPLHSAFHTPLMQATADRAAVELADLPWAAPQVPLVDGEGRAWRPRWADPDALRDYTLGAQVTEAFDFTAMVRTMLGAYGPDAVVLPGPGSNLGGAVAQVMIGMGWQGLTDKDAFLARQRSDRPVLISLRWPDQRGLVCR
ncbi:MAG: ACP S-malonyltransferase [Alphaproteobacteria bacterium]|nr:ACP S-malonyltransferase [Alphaproteobacteria bacterium]